MLLYTLYLTGKKFNQFVNPMLARTWERTKVRTNQHLGQSE
jgi:hypothetical protein